MSTSTPNIEAPASLWGNPSFVRLWFAQTVSNAGSQITAVVLPLTAVLVLGATPVQMGFLGIAGRAPNLLFDLFAGVWVDRTADNRIARALIRRPRRTRYDQTKSTAISSACNSATIVAGAR
jgi:hypothetical protein